MGRTITVKVTGSKTGYTTTTKTSTGRIVYGALTAPVPAISGDAKVGSRLSVVAGVWGPDPVALAYQWGPLGHRDQRRHRDCLYPWRR